MEEREDEEIDPVGVAGEERGGGDREHEGAEGGGAGEEPGEEKEKGIADRFLHEIAVRVVEGLQSEGEDGESGEGERERAGAQDTAPVEAEGGEGHEEVRDADELNASGGEMEEMVEPDVELQEGEPDAVAEFDDGAIGLEDAEAGVAPEEGVGEGFPAVEEGGEESEGEKECCAGRRTRQHWRKV